MLFSDAVRGYELAKSSGNFSARTVRMYRDNLNRLVDFLGDPEIEQVKLSDLQRFMLHMRTTYVPKRFNGSEAPISMPYLDIQWKTIRSFFKWASGAEILQTPRPDLKLERPKYKPAEIVPFSQEEIKKILYASEWSIEVVRNGMRAYRIHQKNFLRNKLIVMMLLDTGMRIGELCRLKVEDVNQTTGAVLVRPFETGQKTQPRMVYLCTATRHQLWLYLASLKKYEPSDRLIPLVETPIRSMLKSIEERSGVEDVHPHRFRHTFAIEFLRNGGDVFNLKLILGHSTLEMVQHYLNLSNADTASAHKKASPVDRWKL